MDLLRKQDLDWLKEKGDEALDFEEIIKGFLGKVAEAGDGLAIHLFANQINKWLSPKLSDNVKIELHQVFDSIIKEDYEKALLELPDVITTILANKEVDPKILSWIIALTEIYKGIIQQLI